MQPKHSLLSPNSSNALSFDTLLAMGATGGDDGGVMGPPEMPPYPFGCPLPELSLGNRIIESLV